MSGWSRRIDPRWVRLSGLALAFVFGAPLAARDGSPTLDDAYEYSARADPAPVGRHDQGEIRLKDLKQSRSLARGADAVPALRAEALKESAQAYGARAGFYARVREINQGLDREAARLDAVFPFAPLLLAHHVIPPVIQVGRDAVRQNSRTQLRFADAVFHIVAPAKFSLSPPDWRTYLYGRATLPEPPDETLLPDRARAAEVELWERYVERGWKHGVRQAHRTFEVQLHRLERDLIGMARYRELLAKNMVTPPRVTEALLGVTDSGHTLLVNDRVLEIAENTRFVADNQRWRPYPTKPYRPDRRSPPVNVRVLGQTPVPPPPPPPPPPRADRNAFTGAH